MRPSLDILLGYILSTTHRTQRPLPDPHHLD